MKKIKCKTGLNVNIKNTLTLETEIGNLIKKYSLTKKDIPELFKLRKLCIEDNRLPF